MAASTNSDYGHNAILARYVGLSRTPPILGYLLHGWYPWFPWDPDADADVLIDIVPALVPILVWKKQDERRLRAAGARRVVTIGAPFLYLLRMCQAPPAQKERSLVAFPFHTHASASFEDAWDEYAAYLRTLEGYERITVCLHPEDYVRPDVRAYFEQGGFEVATNGRREDPTFLWRFHELVSRHCDVTSNRLTTAVLYGAAMGRRTFLGGPVPSVTVHEFVGPLQDEGERADRYQREHYPKLIEGLDPAAAREFGWSQLGGDCLRAPEELRRILGWSGPRRVTGQLLGLAGEVRRRVKGL